MFIMTLLLIAVVAVAAYGFYYAKQEYDKVYAYAKELYYDNVPLVRDNEDLRAMLRSANRQLEQFKDTIQPPYTITEVRVTAYAPYDNKSGICADENPSVTSTGTTPGWGTIAVDPAKIPYGTLLYVPGYGIGIASDTGSALRSYDGYAIDVFFETHDEAIQWGSQTLDIIVLDRIKKEEWVGLKFVKEEHQHDE